MERELTHVAVTPPRTDLKRKTLMLAAMGSLPLWAVIIYGVARFLD